MDKRQPPVQLGWNRAPNLTIPSSDPYLLQFQDATQRQGSLTTQESRSAASRLWAAPLRLLVDAFAKSAEALPVAGTRIDPPRTLIFEPG